MLFLREGFKRCLYEHTLYTKPENGRKMLMVCLYVDDLIYTGNNMAMFENSKTTEVLDRFRITKCNPVTIQTE